MSETQASRDPRDNQDRDRHSIGRDGPFSQLSIHAGRRVDFPGEHGPIAALHGPVPDRARATVLLLPGYTGSKEDFAPLLDGIAEGGFLPVAVDLPGQFESAGSDDESAYLPSALGAVLAELITSLTDDGPVLLLGHSYGGLVARAAVLAGAPIQGLTLLSSGPGKLPPGMRLQAMEMGEPILRGQGLEAAYALGEQLLPNRDTEAGELPTFLRTRFVTSRPACLLGMALGLRTEPDRVNQLASVLHDRGIPGCVVTGESDDAWSVPAQKDMAAQLGVSFSTISGAGHSPNIDTPGKLLDVLLDEWNSWLPNN